MDKFIDELALKKTPCFFVSPHLDDAAFSAGDLMTKLAVTNPVTVVNVFTRPGTGKDNLSAKAFLKQSKFADKTSLFQTREEEDLVAMSSIGVKVLNLEFVDALWRSYPTYRFHVVSGKIAKSDQTLILEIRNKLEKLVTDGAIVFCPAGIGKHADHIIVREACKAFPQTIYWADFPYRKKHGLRNNFVQDNGLEPISLRSANLNKKTLCLKYKSQVDIVIPDASDLLEPEIYFFPRKPSNESSLNATIFNSLNIELERQWLELWENSELRHFFNHPRWFKATTEESPQHKIVAVFRQGKLVAVFPVVAVKKFGVTAFSGPGGNFLDRSSCLFLNQDPTIIRFAFEQMMKLGNVFLNEIPEEIANLIMTTMPNFESCFASINFDLSIEDEPLRYLNNKHRKQIKRIIDLEGDNFRVELFQSDAITRLPLVRQIENTSGKETLNRHVFSNVKLQKILENLSKTAVDDTLTSFLYYKNEPIAYEFGFLTGSTWHLFQMGFNENFVELSPGRVLLYLTIPKVWENGVRLIDFSRGANRLKKDFTPHQYRQYSLFYSPNGETRAWWKAVIGTVSEIAKRPKVFEAVRSVKHGLKI